LKQKEENNRIKYSDIENNYLKNIKNLEEEYNMKIDSLNLIIKENNKNHKKIEEEKLTLIEKSKNFENFFDTKQEEFMNIISDKDKRFKDLEISVKQICSEANSEIEHLNEIISDYNKKYNEYLDKEKLMRRENMDLKQNLDFLLTKIKNLEENYNKFEEESKKNIEDFTDEVKFFLINQIFFIKERRIKK